MRTLVLILATLTLSAQTTIQPQNQGRVLQQQVTGKVGINAGTGIVGSWNAAKNTFTFDLLTGLSPFVTFPEDFGAKGDGITLDTVAIQNAISSACASANRIVYFRKKTYLISSLIGGSNIFSICSDLTITGEGTIKVESGSYRTIFGATTPVSNFVLSGVTLNMNSTNNPIPNLGDLATSPRIVLHTGNGGSNNKVDRVHVTDVRSVWVFFIASSNSAITNNVIDNVGGGAVATDSSLIYNEFGSPGFVATGNTIISSARNAPMAVTAFETHSSAVVSNNIVRDMLLGGNITGIDSSTTVGVTVSENVVTGAFGCWTLWSNSARGATGYGLDGAVVNGNTCAIAQRSYLTVGGQAWGIVLSGSNNLPARNIRINNNVVSFEHSDVPTDPFNTASIGIGYWDTTFTGGCFNCDISNNLVTDAPSNCYRLQADGANWSFDNDVGINCGSSPNPGLIAAYRAGLFIATSTAPVAGFISVKGGTFIDTLATSRMGYGVELATVNTSGIIIDGVTVSCIDVACASLVNAIGPNTNTQLPYVRATVNAPVGSVLSPATSLAVESSIYSTRTAIQYIWDGISYTPRAQAIDWTKPGTIGSAIQNTGDFTRGTFSQGISIYGPLSLAAALGPWNLSVEGSVGRAYCGDGTGFSCAFTKRVGGINTDLLKIQDDGSIVVGLGGLWFGATQTITAARVLQNVTGSASQWTSGTLPDAQLSSNVPLKNGANVFTADQIIQKSAATLTLDATDASGSSELILKATSAVPVDAIVGELLATNVGGSLGVTLKADLGNVFLLSGAKSASLNSTSGNWDIPSGGVFSINGVTGLTTTVVVPCGTLTFTGGILTNKGTC